MAVELLKDVLKLEQVIGETMAQAIVEGDILVPDTKPDITRVLSTEARVQLGKTEVKDGKIVIEGTTYFKILYVSEKGEEPLYSMDSSAGFRQNIDIDGMTSTMKGEVKADVEHIDFVINNERKIGIKAVISLIAKAIEEQNIEISKDIAGLEDVQILKESFKYTDIVGSNESQALAKDNFEIEEGEYGIEEVLKWNATVIDTETKITDGKIIVGGTVNVELLYIEEVESSLKIIKRQIPFTHFVEIAGVFSDMECKLKLSLDEFFYNVKEDIRGEKKIVEIEAIVKVNTKVMETQSREILIDAYSPSKMLTIEKKEIQVKENIGIDKSELILREIIDLPGDYPPIMKVFSVCTKPILSDYSLAENKVAIEGILEATVIYSTEDEAQSLYSFKQEIPFRHYIDVDGLDENMYVDMDLFIQDTDYGVVNGAQIEVKIDIGLICEAYGKKTVNIISNIEELEEDIDLSKRPSLIVYFIQPEDTLWNIAKRYNTTVERLMEGNGIEDSVDIKPGDNIIIEKVHSFKF